MPSLGADMESGKIVEWRIAPGDAVHRGDIVAVVDTEKADIEIEVFEDGVVDELLVEIGQEVAVGTPIALISSGAEPPTVPARRTDLDASEVRARTKASPLARRRAAERGIELTGVSGSGPGGAVLVGDIAATTEPARSAQAPPKTARAAAMRERTAELMARSKREIPHYYLATTVDLAATTEWLDAANARRAIEERLLPAAVLLKATALAAREVPGFNGFWDGGFKPAARVHVGVAVSVRGGGLVAPALHDADRLNLDQVMAGLRDLVARTRSGRLRSSEMSAATLTVTNLGDQGADEVFGVIYPPQVALIGFGRIVQRPWAVEGMVGSHPTVRATLAGDHRASDGHEGSRFLAVVERLLQHPASL
jgi:pyruvate dehydrogenase E2 component (dihydrolipoamide acetyltransferase)